MHVNSVFSPERMIACMHASIIAFLKCSIAKFFQSFSWYCCKGGGIMSYLPYEKELPTARARGTETIYKWLGHTAA
jgi:hypothetical protein